MKDFDSLGMLQGLLGTNSMAGSVSLHKMAFEKTLKLNKYIMSVLIPRFS